MDERGVRRSLTLSDHMATEADEQLRDNNLKVRDEAGGGERRSLGAAIASERREAFAASGSSGSRTLKDIIREEHAMSRGEFPLGPGGAAASGNWRSFKDRLRIRRDGDGDGDEGGVNADPPLSIGLPTSPVFGRQMTNRRPEMPPAARASFRNIGYTPPAAVVAQAEAQSAPPEDPPAEVGGGGEDPGAPAVEPVRMSLMALLADGGDDDDDEDDDDDDDDEDGDDDGEEVFGKEGMYVCCVCMVRHKGAAFIPCGHTFCRLCSRELWVSRGNCPLCNGYILEILDIF